jgi:hypothetical protein
MGTRARRAKPDFAVGVAQPDRHIANTVDAEESVRMSLPELRKTRKQPQFRPIAVRDDLEFVHALKVQQLRDRVDFAECGDQVW